MRRVGSAERKRPCVTGWLRFKNFKGRPVVFLLDTGAELNILSATDARLIGIDLASYPQPNPPIEIRGVGGDVPNEAVGILKDCTVEFASSHGPWQAIVGDMLVIKDEKYASKYHSISPLPDFISVQAL